MLSTWYDLSHSLSLSCAKMFRKYAINCMTNISCRRSSLLLAIKPSTPPVLQMGVRGGPSKLKISRGTVVAARLTTIVHLSSLLSNLRAGESATSCTSCTPSSLATEAPSGLHKPVGLRFILSLEDACFAHVGALDSVKRSSSVVTFASFGVLSLCQVSYIRQDLAIVVFMHLAAEESGYISATRMLLCLEVHQHRTTRLGSKCISLTRNRSQAVAEGVCTVHKRNICKRRYLQPLDVSLHKTHPQGPINESQPLTYISNVCKKFFFQNVSDTSLLSQCVRAILLGGIVMHNGQGVWE